MRYRHASKVLRRIDEEVEFGGSYAAEIVKSFRMRMQTIRAATDETVLYQLKSLHYEKLKGRRGHQRSIRLNKQFRLILEIEKHDSGNVMVVVNIEDYH